MLNQCQFIGNLGKDPEIRRTKDGRPIANFSLAVTQKWRDKNSSEQKERTEWVRIVCFNEHLCKTIEQYVKKGSKLFISGQMQTRKWQDQNGQDKYSTEIVLQGFDSKMVMLDGRKDNDSQQHSGGGYTPSQSHQAPLNTPSDLDDEIPF